MIDQNFYNEFAKIIEVDASALNDNFVLAEECEWDSLAFIGTIALIDRLYGIIVNAEDLENAVTMADVIGLLYQEQRAA